MRPQPITATPQNLTHLSGTVTKATTTDPADPVPTDLANTADTSTTSNSPITGKSAQSRREPTGTTKLSVYVPTEIAERARTAWRQSGVAPGSQMLSWSGWISAAIEQALLDAERDHNDGKPFDPTPAGISPVGKTPQF